ncbi:MAG: hypothetical protein V3U57_08280 [Robiginitomaculum sp.]
MARITNKITSIDPVDFDTNKAKPVNIRSVDLENAITNVVPKRHENEFVPKRVSRAITSPPSASIQIDTPSFGWIRVVSTIATVLWLAFTALICLSLLKIQDNWQAYSAIQWLGFAALICGPLLMIFVGTYALKQLSKVSSYALKIAHMAERMTTPDQMVVGKSKTMAAAIKEQVDDVNQKLASALGRLATMEDMLGTQTQALARANEDASNTADGIAASLTAQTSALDDISGTFDNRMGALATMITNHTDNLTKATQLAEQKLKEARISIEETTAKINSASDTVRANTVQAASTLAASHQEIQSLGDIIKQCSVELDGDCKKHAGVLTEMIDQLHDEQQVLGSNLEERLLKMRDLSLSAQASAESLVIASEAGKDTVETLAKSASLADSAVKARFENMKEMVRYSNDQAQSISDKAAQRVKDSLEFTRLEIARIEQDMTDLQGKLGNKLSTTKKIVDLVEEPLEVIETGVETQKNTKPKRRWARLKLKPIEDENHKVGNLESDKLDLEAINAKGLDIPSRNQPVPESEGHKLEEAGTFVSWAETPELYLEPVSEKDIPEKYPILNTIRRTVLKEANRENKSKSKPNFSVFNLFCSKAETNAGLSIADALNPAEQSVENESVMTELTLLDLAPNTVIDDGCIIEAANSRVSQGHEAMSRVVIGRLQAPVQHLVQNLAANEKLGKKVIKFAQDYDLKIEALAGNREAIITRLEGEQGRAYLLCDAALSYGHL